MAEKGMKPSRRLPVLLDELFQRDHRTGGDAINNIARRDQSDEDVRETNSVIGTLCVKVVGRTHGTPQYRREESGVPSRFHQ